MRAYPCYLKSRETGNVYLFEKQGTLCTLYIRGSKSDGTNSVGGKTHVGYDSENMTWWEEYQVTYKYDPKQAGDTDEDV